MNLFVQQLANRVLLCDGAMGTAIHALDLDLHRDYLGKENCSEVLLLTRPQMIQAIHESYLQAGADVVETNTFGANKVVLAEFDLADRCREINAIAARTARAAAARFTSPAQPRFVAGSIGPGTKLLTLGNTTWPVMLDSYTEQARGLLDGEIDVFLIETCQDLLQVKCAINACLAALAERGRSVAAVPIMAQVTIETTGTMLLGTEIETAAAALEPFPILSLGMNCATGPTEMAEHVHWLGKHWPRYISVQPNAGLPTLVNGRTEYPLKPGPFAQALHQYVVEAGVNIVGGCCGTTPEHIRELARLIGACAPTKIAKAPPRAACTSLYDVQEYSQDASILFIGERTNASGSRAFKKLLEAEDWDAMVSLAREQLREGSHLIDINVDYAGRDNARDMAQVVQRFVRQVNAPLMLDSTQAATLEAGLRCAAGKCVINSANLEEGEEKFARLVQLAKTYGAALVMGCIDEDKEEAMARTADRKLAIARRLHRLAVAKHGFDPRDIFFDPLVLPISTGMEKDRRSALETIEGVRRIAAAFPECQIVAGLSNVSFGLKPAARVVLNSAFLHELTEAGLTSAILHASKILPQNKIPADQWHAALELIYDRRQSPNASTPGSVADPLQRFIDLFTTEAAPEHGADADAKPLTLEDRLRRHIIDGEKRGLIETLDQARAQYSPLQIVNDHLLDGMKTVGELFGSGQMQLPFVLQSAEVMKMAVAHLQQFMEKASAGDKGAIVLATVKGDVHDIGKNLVDIILTNNGYTVHNLGIKQPIHHIIEKWRQTNAHAIGLSGLLVKSVQVMKENLDELNNLGITIPVILGGAALSRHYCENDLRQVYRGPLYYGRDAFEGLRLLDAITTGQTDPLNQEIAARLTKRAAVEKKVADGQRQAASAATAQPPVSKPQTPTAPLEPPVPCTCVARSAKAPSPKHKAPIPSPPFWGDRVIEHIDPAQIYPFINKVALFRGQWQFKKGRMTDAEYEAQLHDDVEPLFARLGHQCKEERILQPQVVYGYFPCASADNDLIVYDPVNPDREIERFTFPRQKDRQRLCISDFFAPAAGGKKDVLGVMCVTVGPEASRRTHALFAANQYTEYLYLHGFCVEAAEALAEMWHKRIRQELGIDHDDASDIRGLFTQGYRGSRYSFGYPACPDMSAQEKLFRLLKPERIGCRLTENWQIDPEQSTSALVVHHPNAKYFNV